MTQTTRERALALLEATRAGRLVAPDAATSWTGPGVKLGDFGPAQISPRVLYDGVGGGLFGWMDYRNTRIQLFAQHLDGNGDFVSGWNTKGVQLLARDTSVFNAEYARDNVGGFYAVAAQLDAYPFTDLYVTRMNASGAFPSGFTVAGTPVGASQPDRWKICADPSGAYVAWSTPDGDLRLQRIASTGGIAAGWPATGVLVTTGIIPTAGPLVVSDGGTGAYLVFSDGTSIYVQRYLASSSLSAGWPIGGVVAATNLNFPVGADAALLNGGDLMLAWADFLTLDEGIVAQRIASSGAVASGWPAAGVVVNDDVNDQVSPHVVSDGAGGAIFGWFNDKADPVGDLYALRLTGTGAVSSGWPAGGVLLNTPTKGNTVFVESTDGTGGGLFSWEQARTDSADVMVQRVTSAGAIASGWAAGGVLVGTITSGLDGSDMTGDGSGGAIATWITIPNGMSFVRAMAGRVGSSGTVPALAALVDASAESGRVRLHWFAPGTVTSVTVERAEGGGAWQALASIVQDGDGALRYEDTDVVAGHTYSYRLAILADGVRSTLGEVTLSIPATTSFALGGFRPNPPDSRFQLAFALPDAAPARIEVLDVSGRRVGVRDLGTPGAGEHVVSLSELTRLGPGLYFVRLTRAGQSLTTRLVRME